MYDGLGVTCQGEGGILKKIKEQEERWNIPAPDLDSSPPHTTR